LAISLPAGTGRVFVNDMEKVIKTISTEIPKAFDNNDYENEKNRILQEFQDKRSVLVEKLNVAAEKQGFKVKTTPNGIYFLPIVNGEAISEEEFGVLREFASKKMYEMGTEILSGNVKKEPYVRNEREHGCQYCPYLGACGYDPTRPFAAREIEKLSDEDALSMMRLFCERR
jgi:ATP-dependent helicase/DNAse subunit B